MKPLSGQANVLTGKVGWKLPKKMTYQAYIRTYSNQTATVLTANAHKTEESVITDNILTQFHGIIARDHEAKFYHFGDRHAACGAHLTRELKGMFELQMLPRAGKVRRFFPEMNKQKKETPMREKLHAGLFCCANMKPAAMNWLARGKARLQE